jgi:3-hydroxybutyryl-CoA dehydrogenase
MKTSPAAYCRGLAPSPDVTPEKIDELEAQLEKAYDSLVLTTSYAEAAADADLVIEAIAEDPKQKIAFYTELAKHLPVQTIICTNSSTMLPSTFASYTGRPEKYLGLHFANEIWKNNTAEVMGHAGTSREAYDEVVEFASAIRMIPLCLHKEQPGYILNSMLVPFLNAAEMLYATGVADPETIDKTWMLATGAPAGPFRILDIVGLATAYNIVVMSPDAKDPETVPGKIAAVLKEKIDRGETGVNAGKGFYTYR